MEGPLRMSGGEGKLTQNGHPIGLSRFQQQTKMQKMCRFCQALDWHCLLIVQCKASQLRDFDSSAQSCLLEDAHNIFHNRKISYFCLKASTVLCLPNYIHTISYYIQQTKAQMILKRASPNP